MRGAKKPSLPKVVLIGRPNVGKSTLFNRFIGRKIALVHNQPGMTRDCKEENVTFMGLSFNLIDTPGFSDLETKKLSPDLAKAMHQKTIDILKEARIILFLIDGQEGCTSDDLDLAMLLRRQKAPIIVVVNKCEGKSQSTYLTNALNVGKGDPIYISAEHNLGISDLGNALSPYLDEVIESSENEKDNIQKTLNLAIMGRPNVGKSTLVNSFLKEEKVLTANFPGVTRDSIALSWQYKQREITLVDTAGIRRKNRIDNQMERIAVIDAEKTLRFAELIILVLDASVPIERRIEKQDLTLASQIIKEGRGLIIALNKWDQTKSPKKVLSEIRHQFDTHLSQSKGLAYVPVSALHKKNLDLLMDQVLETERIWNYRLSTAQLNRWLLECSNSHPPPIISGNRIRLKYITQIKTRPPTFIVFCTKAEEVPDSYQRYLINSLRQHFKLPGVPIRLNFRSNKNPYVDR